MAWQLVVVNFLIWFTLNSYGQTESRETHFPGYHFCGPGTDFLERIARGQLGINKLDEACRLHDSVYTDSTDFQLRMVADMKLETQAWERVIAKDSSYKEKFAAWMVTNIMKVKRKWNTRRLQREFGKKRLGLSTNDHCCGLLVNCLRRSKNHDNDVQLTTTIKLGSVTDYSRNYTEIETKQ